MNTLVTSVLLVLSTIVYSQQSDTSKATIEDIKAHVLKVDNEIRLLKENSLMAGDNLCKANQNHLFSIVSSIIGSGAVVGGIFLDEPSLIVVGGGLQTVGIVLHFTAWSKINKAGKSLKPTQ